MSSPTSDSRAALGRAAFLVIACVVATLWRAIPGDLVFFQRDIFAYWLPHIEVFVRALRAGDLPLWNAYVGFGTPLLADPNFELLYPPTWLVLLIPPPDYYRLFVVGHAVFAGLGTVLLARRLGLPTGASAVAGAVYAVSGPLLSAASLFHHYAGAAWMPWVLSAFVSLRLHPSARTALAMSLAVIGQLLAGSADLSLMTALLGLGWLAWHELDRTSAAHRGRFARGLAAAMVVGVAVCCLQWVPTIDLVSEGARGSLPLEARTSWSIHPASLLDLFAPQLLGRLPLALEARAALFEGREPLLVSMFLGVPALGLAVLGALQSTSRWRGYAVSAFGGALLLSLGRFTPAFALVHAVPPLSLIRYPAKYLLPMALAWALLVGLGGAVWLERWEAPRKRGARWAVGSLFVVAVALALGGQALLGSGQLLELLDRSWLEALPQLRWVLFLEAALATLAALVFWLRSRTPFTTPPLSAALALLVLGDLVLAGQSINPLAPRALVETPPPVVAALPAGARILVARAADAETAALYVESPLRSLGKLGSALVALETLTPPLGARFGLFGSIDDDFTGLAPPLQNALALVVAGHEDWPVGRQGLRLGGVDYVVDVGRNLAGLDEVARFDSSLGVPLRVLRVRETQPRAYVVEGVKNVPDHEAVETLITRTDLKSEAVVSGGLPARPAAAGFAGTASIVERRTNLLVIEASANRPGVLVVLEAYREGWTAKVDGEPAPLLRTNALFRGVALPAGSHLVEMAYLPRSVVLGGILSVLGLVGLAALALMACRRPALTD